MKTDPAIKDLADSMDEIARETVAWHKEAWGRNGTEGYDAGMMRAGRNDAADHRRIGALLRKGKFSEAAKFANQMDTMPRENIPDNVWGFLQLFRK